MRPVVHILMMMMDDVHTVTMILVVYAVMRLVVLTAVRTTTIRIHANLCLLEPVYGHPDLYLCLCEQVLPVGICVCLCDDSESGSMMEADEGWETVQPRTNKTKSRQSPTTNGPPLSVRTSGPATARQADRRPATQPRCSDGNNRSANVAAAVSRQTDVKKQQPQLQQQGSALSIDVNGNSRGSNTATVNCTAAAQQSKSTSHIGSRASTEHGVKSSPRPLSHYPSSTASAVCSGESHVKSETCLTTAADDGMIQYETDIQGSGDRRLITGNAAETQVNDGLCERQTQDKSPVGSVEDVMPAMHDLTSSVKDVTVPQCDRERPSVSSVTDVTSTQCDRVTRDKPSFGVVPTHSVSLTEVRRTDSIVDTSQLSSADSTDGRHSSQLCRKSLSEDTLVDRLTISGLCFSQS